jgi:hypothetical protein
MLLWYSSAVALSITSRSSSKCQPRCMLSVAPGPAPRHQAHYLSVVSSLTVSNASMQGPWSPALMHTQNVCAFLNPSALWSLQAVPGAGRRAGWVSSACPPEWQGPSAV